MQLIDHRRIWRYRFAALLLAVLFIVPRPAHAASKEIIELQTQVQQLLDMVQRLQSTVDSRFGLVQHLVEQSTDSVNQMNATVATMQQKLNAQNESTNGKLDSVSGQVQSLNDSLDEMKTRIAKLDKQLQDIQSQLQNVQAQSTATTATMPGGIPPQQQGQPNGGQPMGGQPMQDGGGAPNPGIPDAGASQAPPLQETYQSGLRDYNAAKYDLAFSEFGDVLHYYPQDDLAGDAQFYVGEIAYRQQKYKDAVKSYNAVLENFPGNRKAPAAQLRKGLALIQLNQKDAGVHELRSLIQRHPQTPEALQARSKLNALGVRITPATR
ncbi:tetratricopeptide repeat protein [Acidicapsa ligni]|uniref:tetratricopeptide repeat protein n=1 Tax=Acidicapsa ligni TaxID=542300 RepID=UPI0021E0AE0C|nr:tetratricopeptide repeat protein [Acidicapsa ligni]